MTDITATGQKIPLGIGRIIGDVFSIFFGNFFKVLLISFGVAFTGFLLNALFTGLDVASGLAEPDLANVGALAGWVASILVDIMTYALAIALLVQLAYDAKLGRTNSFRTYFSNALPALFPIILMAVGVWLLVLIGMLALFVGALWVAAVFYVIAPAAVIERIGFGAWSRSIALTKAYRWPIVGLFIIFVILTLVIGGVLATVGIVTAAGLGLGGVMGAIALGVVMSLLTGMVNAIGGITVALTYARLREIKEGVDIDQIAAVFD